MSRSAVVVLPSLSAHLRISSPTKPPPTCCCFSGRINVLYPTSTTNHLFRPSTVLFHHFQPLLLLASLPSSSSSSSSSSQAGRFRKWRGIESPPRRLFCSKETQQNDFAYQEQLDANVDGQAPSEVNDSPRSTSAGDSFLNILGELFVGSGENSLSSIKTVVFWVCAAVSFGSVIWLKEGTDKASEFFAGYLLEQSLSVDNLFVFVLVFKYFKVPQSYQGKVLFYGIAGAIVFRATIILLGTATIQRFEAINLLLAAILLFSAYKLFGTGEEEEDLSNNFILKTCQKFISVTPYYVEDKFITIEDGVRKATPLLLTLAVIEFSDIAFAVDSIPAVFGVTRDPFIVLSSNFFAIVGLRSLYTLISSGMSQLNYLQPSIGVVLGFIGCKMIFDYFGFHISTEVSLAFVALCLGTGITLSLTKGKSSED